MTSEQRPVTSELLRKHCVECEGGTPPMPLDKARGYLDAVPGWRLVEGDPPKLVRELKLKSFSEAMALVNKIADLAESEGHHPDMCVFSWNRVRLELNTHAIGGLSENDFILAAKINELMGEATT